MAFRQNANIFLLLLGQFVQSDGIEKAMKKITNLLDKNLLSCYNVNIFIKCDKGNQ